MIFGSSLLKTTFFLATAALSVGSVIASPLSRGAVIVAPSAAADMDRSVVDEASLTELAPNLRRQLVNYSANVTPGTVIVDTAQTFLYFVIGDGTASATASASAARLHLVRSQSVSRKAEWPDWHPPAEMIARQPYLARFTAGGEGNPLGARAIYLGNTMYRIHGTNMPETIGTNVSSGCIRLLDADVIDLYSA